MTNGLELITKKEKKKPKFLTLRSENTWTGPDFEAILDNLTTKWCKCCRFKTNLQCSGFHSRHKQNLICLFLFFALFFLSWILVQLVLVHGQHAVRRCEDYKEIGAVVRHEWVFFLFVCFKWALVQVTKTLWRTFDEVFRTIHIKLYHLHLFLRLDVLEMSQHSVWFEIVFQSSSAPTQHSTSFWINKFCAVTNFFRITLRPSNANHFIWAALLKRQWR